MVDGNQGDDGDGGGHAAEVVLKEIELRRSSWNEIVVRFRMTHVALGLVGVLGPLVVSSFAESLGSDFIKILSFVSAAATAVFAAFDVGGASTRFREAWKELNAAYLKYMAGDIKLEELVKAYEKGERTIGQMRPDPFKNTDDGAKKGPR